MGNDLDKQSYLERLSNSVFNADWMQKLYGKTKAEQQAELNKLFTVAADNDVTSANKARFDSQMETLQDKVERLEAKMAVLAEEMAKSEEEIARRAKEITDLVASVEDNTEKMQEEQRDIVKYATEDVFYLYKNGKIGHDAIVPEIRRRIEGEGVLTKYGNVIDRLLGKLDGKQAQVQGLVNDAARWMDQKNILEAQYGATKSAYDLIKKSQKQVGNTNTTYTNNDFDSAKPVYSPSELGIISDLHENYFAEPEAKEGKPEKMSIGDITEKYKDLLGQSNTSDDKCSYDNKAVQNLEKLLKTDIFKDFALAGMEPKEIDAFFAQHFSGANIYIKDDTLSVPYGHGSEAKAVYDELIRQRNEYGTGIVPGGRTISDTNQLGELQQFFNDGKFAELKNNGFTFKEAMHALFNEEDGLFKDTGILYQYDKQTDGLKYFVEYPGDQATKELYDGLIAEIDKQWGVKPARTMDVADRNETGEPESEPTPEPTKPDPVRNDPLSFTLDDDPNSNNKFSFVIDRDGDGKFNNNDFVGATANQEGGKTWLEDLQSLDENGDGKLTGAELEKLKIFGTNYTDGTDKTDNHAYDPNRREVDKDYVREDETVVEYSMQNALKFGITEIDLNNLENNVTQGPTGKLDANGNEIFEDKLTFKMGDKTVTAKRLDETEEFMNKIYGGAQNKNFQINLSATSTEEVFEKDYGEFEEFNARYADLFKNVEVLKNAGQIAQEARELYKDAFEHINNYTSAELLKAGNRAAAEENVSGWNSVAGEIQGIAQKEGIVIDMTQAKGIYVLDASLDARGVVEKYKEQQAMIADANNFEAIQKEAWSAIILLAQEGIKPETEQILEMLNSGQAKTAEEILAILKEAQGEPEIDVELVTQEITFDTAREEEVYTAFKTIFKNAGIDGGAINALWELCKKEMQEAGFMLNKTGEELAQYFLEKELEQ